MAFIGHFIVGLSIIIPLYLFNRENFNYKVAVIFVLSNWLGPDSAQAYFFLKWDFTSFEWDFHYLLPFLLWSVLLAFLYSYMSRFSVVRLGRILRINDDGYKTLDWKNAYFLAVSGGIIHTITDTLSRKNLKVKFFDSFIEPTIIDLQYIGADLGIQTKDLQIITYFIMIVFTFLLFFVFKQKMRDILIYFGSLIVVIVVGGLAIGDGFLGGEYDIGVTISSIIFVFIPLMLLMYVFYDVRKNPKDSEIKNEEKKRSNHKENLIAISIITIIIAGIVLALGILSITKVEFLVSSLDFSDIVFTILGVLLTLIGSCGVLSGIGLILEINVARITTMILFSLLLIFVFPLAIVLYLSQNEVIVLFKNKERMKKENEI